jgi:hypothetical protein
MFSAFIDLDADEQQLMLNAVLQSWNRKKLHHLAATGAA